MERERSRGMGAKRVVVLIFAGALAWLASGCAVAVDDTGEPGGSAGGGAATGGKGTPDGAASGKGGGGGASGGGAGAGAASGAGGAGSSAGAGGSGAAAGAGGASGGGGISGGGTGLTSAQQMFDWVNQTRKQYQTHIPYDGYPFEGQNAQAMTWASQMTWDDGLAVEAQAEADALAGGAKPKGKGFPFQNDGAGEPFWATGLETPKYMVSSRADASLPQFKNAYGVMEPPHHFNVTANGFYRMAVAYQTGTGSTNKKSRLGVGAAEASPGVTWWVLLFGE